MAWIAEVPPSPRHPKRRWQVRYQDGKHQRSAGIYPTQEAAERARKRASRGLPPILDRAGIPPGACLSGAGRPARRCRSVGSGGSSGARWRGRSQAGRRSGLQASPCSESRIISRRQPTRWGPCSRRSRSQGSSAGQEGLAYTLGGRILAAASSGRLVCGSSNDRRGYCIGDRLDHSPGLRAKLLVSCLEAADRREFAVSRAPAKPAGGRQADPRPGGSRARRV